MIQIYLQSLVFIFKIYTIKTKSSKEKIKPILSLILLGRSHEFSLHSLKKKHKDKHSLELAFIQLIRTAHPRAN